jgi:hypothetical protein
MCLVINNKNQTYNSSNNFPVVDTAMKKDTTAKRIYPSAKLLTSEAKKKLIELNTNTSNVYGPDDSLAVSSKSITDSQGYTPKDEVASFFNYLDLHFYDQAWSTTNNPDWKLRGYDWFMSEAGYGSVKRVVIKKIYETENDTLGAKVFVFYYAEGAGQSKSCYTQEISTEIDNNNEGKPQWFITHIRNLKKPFGCEISN